MLLDGVSGQISLGFYAIMGPSGSGKTTLLNSLACRLDKGTKMMGELRLNGKKYTLHDLKMNAGYGAARIAQRGSRARHAGVCHVLTRLRCFAVMQDDLLNGNLTVLETLKYTAELRLPRSVTAEDRNERIRLVMEQMGLTKVQDVIVGSPLKKGVSGGERKRLCVAMELLTKPMLLFLDEPTSGLDSVTALSLCRKLRELADAKVCTVACTIHQPQAKIFKLFQNLVLLKSGKIVYMGPTEKAHHFFEGLGFKCPEFENPADYFLDVITPSPADSVEDLQAKERKLVERSREMGASEVDLLAGIDRPLLPRETTPWLHQFKVLFRRTMKDQWRRRSLLVTQLVQTVIMAVLIGTAFLDIGTSETSVVRRQPVLFFCVINQGIFGALLVINSFPAERMLVLRERAAGTYYVSAYFLAKSMAELIFQLIFPLLFTCVVYFIVNLHDQADRFFVFMGFMVLTNVAATSLALMVSALCRTTDMSVTVLPLMLEVSRLFGGFFLSPSNLPVYFSWLDALSYVKYTYVGIALNELQGLNLHCSDKWVIANPGVECEVTEGEQVIAQLGLDQYTIGGCVGILILYIVFCRAVAFLGVRYIKW